MKLTTKNKIYSIAGLLLLASGLYEAIIDDASYKVWLPLFLASIVFSFAPLKEVSNAIIKKFGGNK